MSTDLCVSTCLGAGSTWREGQSQSPHTPRQISALPSGTSETRLAASSTTALDHREYIKSGPGVLFQSVWRVAEKEQRFNGSQSSVTKSTYSRRRSLPGTVKQTNKERGLGKNLVKGLRCHNSQTSSTVEVVEEHMHTQPHKPEPIEVDDKDEDSSTIVCAIDPRLQHESADSKEQLDKEEKPIVDLDSSTSPPPTAKHLSPKINKNNNNMSSRSSRHSSTSSSSSSSKQKRHLSPPRTAGSPPPKSPKPTSPSPSPRSSPKTDKTDKHKEDDKDDWHQIHEPEQRRRIQNRIAQRKFREKTRSLKDQAARDAQNKKYAGCAYTCPRVDDLPLEYEPYSLDEEEEGGPGTGTGTGVGGILGEEITGGEKIGGGGEKVLSGLPWGGINMHFIIGRGHEYYRYQTSRGSGSGSGTGTGTGTVTSLSPTITALGPPTPTPLATGTSGGGDSWPSLQHSRAVMDYRHMTSGGSAGSPLSSYGMVPMGMNLTSGGNMDVDYTMAGTGGIGDTGMDYVTSPPVSMAGVSPGTGMDVTYYDSSPYYYGYGSGGGDGASGNGGSVYGGHGGRHL